MAAGHSTTPLHKKLGLKEGFRVEVVHYPGDYRNLIGEFADRLLFSNELHTDLDLIHLFTNSAYDLEHELPQLLPQIKKNGAIWVSWHKKSSGKTTDVTEHLIRKIALSIGLVDTKICAVDENWSALKLVWRLKNR